LARRLNPYHPKLPLIKNDIGSYTSGYYGEGSLDYHLDTLDCKKYHIFHGLRLKNDTYAFQIDTLIQTIKYHFILEIKNLIGELFLDTPLNQLIQTKTETQEVYPCPILQAERQQYELQKWLQAHNFPNLPVEKIVVFNQSRFSTRVRNLFNKFPPTISAVSATMKLMTTKKVVIKTL
jgi:hypothetical protein